MGEHHDNVIIYTERSSYIYIHIYMCMCVHISYLQATRTVRHCYRWAWFADVRNVSHTKHTRTNVLGFPVSLSLPPPSLLQNALTRTHRNWFANFVHEHTINTSCVLIRFEWSSIRYNAQICRFKIQFYMDFISCCSFAAAAAHSHILQKY